MSRFLIRAHDAAISNAVDVMIAMTITGSISASLVALATSRLLGLARRGERSTILRDLLHLTLDVFRQWRTSHEPVVLAG